MGDEDYEKVYIFPNSHAGYYPGGIDSDGRDLSRMVLT